MSSKEKLTKKQAIFVKELLSDNKISATEAAARAYNAKTRHVASAVATENLRKPAILAHLAANADRAEAKIVELMESKKPEIQLASAKDILDRVHGKATQKVEQTSVGISLNIDLTGN